MKCECRGSSAYHNSYYSNEIDTPLAPNPVPTLDPVWTQCVSTRDPQGRYGRRDTGVSTVRQSFK